MTRAALPVSTMYAHRARGRAVRSRGATWVACALAIACEVGCGGATEATPPTTAKQTPASKPKCSPGSSSAPENAKGKMNAMQADVRRCFTLGTPGQSESTVKVEVTVAESGEVREAHVVGDSAGHDAAVACMVKSFKGTKFSKFCGDDVSIAWTYALR